MRQEDCLRASGVGVMRLTLACRSSRSLFQRTALVRMAVMQWKILIRNRAVYFSSCSLLCGPWRVLILAAMNLTFWVFFFVVAETVQRLMQVHMTARIWPYRPVQCVCDFPLLWFLSHMLLYKDTYMNVCAMPPPHPHPPHDALSALRTQFPCRPGPTVGGAESRYPGLLQQLSTQSLCYRGNCPVTRPGSSLPLFLFLFAE